MVWDHYLHAVGVDLDSRMQSAIGAPDPVRQRCHRSQIRDRIGGRIFVHIPQIGEGTSDTCKAAPSFPLRRRITFDQATDPMDAAGLTYDSLSVRSSAP